MSGKKEIPQSPPKGSLAALEQRLKKLEVLPEYFDNISERNVVRVHGVNRPLFDRTLQDARLKEGAREIGTESTFPDTLMKLGQKGEAIAQKIPTLRVIVQAHTEITQGEIEAHPSTQKIGRLRELQTGGYLNANDVNLAVKQLKVVVPETPAEKPGSSEEPVTLAQRAQEGLEGLAQLAGVANVPDVSGLSESEQEAVVARVEAVSAQVQNLSHGVEEAIDHTEGLLAQLDETGVEPEMSGRERAMAVLSPEDAEAIEQGLAITRRSEDTDAASEPTVVSFAEAAEPDSSSLLEEDRAKAARMRKADEMRRRASDIYFTGADADDRQAVLNTMMQAVEDGERLTLKEGGDRVLEHKPSQQRAQLFGSILAKIGPYLLQRGMRTNYPKEMRTINGKEQEVTTYELDFKPDEWVDPGETLAEPAAAVEIPVFPSIQLSVGETTWPLSEPEGTTEESDVLAAATVELTPEQKARKAKADELRRLVLPIIDGNELRKAETSVLQTLLLSVENGQGVTAKEGAENALTEKTRQGLANAAKLFEKTVGTLDPKIRKYGVRVRREEVDSEGNRLKDVRYTVDFLKNGNGNGHAEAAAQVVEPEAPVAGPAHVATETVLAEGETQELAREGNKEIDEAVKVEIRRRLASAGLSPMQFQALEILADYVGPEHLKDRTDLADDLAKGKAISDPEKNMSYHLSTGKAKANQAGVNVVSKKYTREGSEKPRTGYYLELLEGKE